MSTIIQISEIFSTSFSAYFYAFQFNSLKKKHQMYLKITPVSFLAIANV
jgi:hypothetical protein